jgi:phage gpG-like protein
MSIDIFDKFKEAVIREKKDQLQRMDKLMLSYFLEHMHTKNNFDTSAKRQIKAQIKGSSGITKLRNKKNSTSELYKLTGDLVRSLTKGGRGNASKIESDATFTFAIDLNEIPYARIHEYGGVAGRGVELPARPYIRPALKDFVENEFPDMAQRIVQAALRAI